MTHHDIIRITWFRDKLLLALPFGNTVNPNISASLCQTSMRVQGAMITVTTCGNGVAMALAHDKLITVFPRPISNASIVLRKVKHV